MADEDVQQHTPVRVVVADDHPVFREGLVCGLAKRDEITVVGDAADGAQAVTLVQRLDPDVAVLDVQMPELDGMEALQRLRRAGARSRVLFLSGHATSELAYLALALGAGGYLTKGAEMSEIADAVVAVAGGATVLAPQIQTALADEIQQRGAAARPVLSEREHQILTMLAEGRSAPAMAGELHLSPATVKTHLTRLYDKLGVSDRAAAVAVGMRRGLLQ